MEERLNVPRLDTATQLVTAALILATSGDIAPMLEVCADVDAEIGQVSAAEAERIRAELVTAQGFITAQVVTGAASLLGVDVMELWGRLCMSFEQPCPPAEEMA